MKLSFTRTIEQWLINTGKRPFLAWTLSVMWLLVIAWVAFFWHLGSIGLVDETEPLFAEASRQMIVIGDWITPYFNGETRFDKPILIYWCQALAYLIFGVNELAVRIPSALAALGLICLLFWTLQSVQITPQRQPLTAPLGAAIMAFNPETIVWARTGVSDILLTSCMASALLCFFLGYAQPLKPVVQARWFLACYVLIALAVLTKSLETMVMTALERPSFYSNIQVEEVSAMTNNPGGFSIGGSVGGNVNNVQGDGNRAVQGDNNQAVLGDGNQVTQQNQVGADASESLSKEDVVKLLAQLETLIKGAELPADTKEEIVEDLSAAKKATDKEEPNKQRALDRLTGVAETLEKTSKSVEAGQKIWTTAKPIIVKIATWLGVAAGSHLLGL
ncbi:MAG: glycosyltransferase family 39 protein [Pelatocladus maniniholoensis HA4357-MV3]|jgi:hypothetical protein|uniref:Glycosyltransferase family 39 protein n=1 Tax=Pelatocladus maniniholoensis HA4357-MV3 TaxID=1117104 RepID=A0A9E3H427_9NOST|nr:glycosyltransferase family 39 protein [Pelatocladus maniniholoensis HA4357-MV3]